MARSLDLRPVQSNKDKKLALIEEIRAVAPKVYNMTATFDMGCEFGGICSAGVVYQNIGMLLYTEDKGCFPDWFYDENSDETFFSKSDDEYDKPAFEKLDLYLCELIDVRYEDLEISDLFGLLYNELLDNDVVTVEYCDKLWERFAE